MREHQRKKLFFFQHQTNTHTRARARQRRGRFTSCKFEHNMSHLFGPLLILLQGQWVWVGALLLLIGVSLVLIFVSEFVTYRKAALPLLDEPAKIIARSGRRR